MIESYQDSPLYTLANPKSVAFFGASNNIGSMGANILSSLLSMGFEGSVYPVHPKEESVQGIQAYPSVLDLPEVPDLAVMVLPTKIVNQTLEECGRKGVRRAVVVSGGFKEVGGQGEAMQQEMVRICRQYGIRVLGPNGLGVANPHARLNTTFIPFEGSPGFIGLASQSGSFVTQMFHYLNGLGLGFSTAFSVGNAADLDLVDCLEYLGACPRTRVITLYIEGIARGRDFIRVAKAITPHKPITAIYVGGSEAGRKAGFSHTASMAGPDELYDGLFRQCGIIRADSITQLFDFAWALGSMPRPDGRGVVIQTHSGGPGAAAADALGRAGFEIPALSGSTVEKLRPFVPHTGSIANPVDLTFSRNPEDFYKSIPEILLEDENLDLLLMYFLTPAPVIERTLKMMGSPEERLEDDLNQIIDLQASQVVEMFKAAKKPVAGYTWRSLEERFSKKLLQAGLPLFPDPKRAAAALKALVRYHEYRDRVRSE